MPTKLHRLPRTATICEDWPSDSVLQGGALASSWRCAAEDLRSLRLLARCCRSPALIPQAF